MEFNLNVHGKKGNTGTLFGLEPLVKVGRITLVFTIKTIKNQNYLGCSLLNEISQNTLTFMSCLTNFQKMPIVCMEHLDMISQIIQFSSTFR